MTQLQVVWPKSWIADEFRAAGIDVKHELGFDIVKQEGPIWWATELAAKSIAAGNKVNLTAPNYNDWYDLPETRRDILPLTLGTLARIKLPENMAIFVKIADSKVVGPGTTGKAMATYAPYEWALNCLEFGVPKHTVCLFSSVINYTDEWRCWFDGENIQEISRYRDNGITWDSNWKSSQAPSLVSKMAQEVGTKIQQPCTIDIGSDYKGNISLVETNPVWSSGPYTSDYEQIYKCIKASYDYALAGKGRQWKPDAWLRKSQRINSSDYNR